MKWRNLDKCKDKGINHLAFEQLNSWNLKGKSKENNEKLNRVFRLIRRTGLVNLFRKQRRNRRNKWFWRITSWRNPFKKLW